MSNASLSESELQNIIGMQMTVDKDFLLPCSKAKSNKETNISAVAEFYAKDQVNKNANGTRQNENEKMEEESRHGGGRPKKNVSFASGLVQGANGMSRAHHPGMDQESIMEFNELFNQSRIINNSHGHQDFQMQNGPFPQNGMGHQGGAQPEIDSGNASRLLQDPFSDNPNIQIAMTPSDAVQEGIMAHMINQGRSGPEYNDLESFKSKLNSKRTPFEIISMYNQLKASQMQQSQSRQEDNGSEMGDHMSNLFSADKNCLICLEEQQQGDFTQIPPECEAIMLQCMHKAHIYCILKDMVLRDNQVGYNCFHCRTMLSQDDLDNVESFVIKHCNSQSLLQQLTNERTIR